jgi:L-fuculose-phosphate aldolase
VSDANLRAAVAGTARRLAASGLNVGTAGNVSARFGRGLVAITPSAMPYDVMTGDDVVVVGADGEVAEGRRAPSSELRMHLAIYEARPDVGAVVHTHSVFATAFAAAGRPIPAVHYAIAPLGDEIRVAPYATFGTAELARSVALTLADDNAVLIASHGAVAVGPDLDVALERARTIEYLAELAYRAATLGGVALFDAGELAMVREQLRRFPRQEPGP